MKLVDTRDSKSRGGCPPCRFESDLPQDPRKPKPDEHVRTALSIPDYWTANVPGSALTRWGIGGVVSYVATTDNIDQLVESVKAAGALGIPWRLIGHGTNLAISDRGYQGLLLRVPRTWSGCGLSQLVASMPVGPPGTVPLLAPAGSPVSAVALRTARSGLSGLEWALGLPGSVGGAIAGNAGALGREMASVLGAAAVVDLSAVETGQISTTWITKDQLAASYRTSRFKAVENRVAVVGALFVLSPEQPALLEQNISAARASRARQPKGPSCGCAFLNPPGNSAGRLIDAAGLKGFRVGGLEVSRIHANFLINKGSATSAHLLQMVNTIRERVHDLFGIWLKPEFEPIGFEKDELEIMGFSTGSAPDTKIQS